jgi:hypothetical protein
MEIIENTGARVIRLWINRPDYWWEAKELPISVNCQIQELSQDGAVNLHLSFATLSKIWERVMAERNKMQDEWLNPTTDCCNTKMPRENTEVEPYGDSTLITCKPGFGCKAVKVYICPETCLFFRGEDGCGNVAVDNKARYEKEGGYPRCPLYEEGEK